MFSVNVFRYIALEGVESNWCGGWEEAGGSGVGSVFVLSCCRDDLFCRFFFRKVQVFWMVCSLAIYHLTLPSVHEGIDMA